MRSADFDRTLADAVLAMAGEPSTPATLDHVVAIAKDSVSGCDAALVLVTSTPEPHCVACTDLALGQVVEDHLRHAAAPVGVVSMTGEAVHIADLATETRWPQLVHELTNSLGFQSLYAVPLGFDGTPIGALAMYSKSADAFEHEDQETADLIAVHATAALGSSVHLDQLSTALASRTVIGQATGIIMDRFGLDATASFGVLRRLSQAENLKLRDIAQRVVETGEIG